MVSYGTQAKDVMGPLEIPGDEKITGSGWNDLPLVIFCLHNWATLFSDGLCLLWLVHMGGHTEAYADLELAGWNPDRSIVSLS